MIAMIFLIHVVFVPSATRLICPAVLRETHLSPGVLIYSLYLKISDRVKI